MKKQTRRLTIKQRLRRLENKNYVYAAASCLYSDDQYREEVRELLQDTKQALAAIWEQRSQLDYKRREDICDMSIWVAKYQQILRVVDDLRTERT